MNDEQLHTYIEKVRSLSLSKDAHARIRGNLDSFAEYHSNSDPVRNLETGRSSRRVLQGAWGFHTFTRLISTHMMAAILIGLLCIGGGTSYAAEGSLPGDLLYPVKVNVNENIESALAVSNAAEARLQAKLVEERLVEAEELAARGTLDATASAELQSRIKAHYTEASEQSEQAKATGDFETSATVQASLEASLRTYAGILAGIDAHAEIKESTALIGDITGYADKAAQAQTTATTEVSANAKADVADTIAYAGTRISAVEATLSNAHDRIDADTYARIRARLDLAIAVHVKAEDALKASLYSDAYRDAQAAIRAAQEAEAMTKSSLRLQVGIDLTSGSVLQTTDTTIRSEGTVRSTTDEERSSTSDSKSEEGAGTSTTTTEDTEVQLNTNATVDVDAVGTKVDANAGANTRVKLGL